MTRSPELLHSDLPKALSQLLQTTLMAAQAKHPSILTEPCRTWLLNASTEAQLSKFLALLAKQPDRPALIKAVDRILDQIFVPAFKGTSAHGKLLQRVEALMALPAAESAGSGPAAGSASANRRSGEYGGFTNAAGAGLLLVDAENMNPPETLETVLQTVAHHPIRYRLAFGNWRKLGRRDQEFYRRGYQMVHVPSGKNSADIKMSLDASLISLRNPSIREVFICSTDSDLSHLGYALLNLGITPYRVSLHHDHFAVLNLAKQTRQVFQLAQSDDDDALEASHAVEVNLPTLAQIQRWLKILILQEQQANPGQPITLSHLGKLFRDRNQISVSQALQANASGKTLKQFLSAHAAFELIPMAGSNQTEVRLKAPAQVPASAVPPQPAQAPDQPTTVAKSEPSKSEPSPNPMPIPESISDVPALEQALIKLLWGLSSQQSGGAVPLSVLSLHFAHVHQESLSSVLKRLGEPKGLPKFLLKCRSLRAYKQGPDWQVALACVS
ncbi:NYN domain-containing protein [Nodosilinea nodulosa]|uniref:NYN domain-containing protein n=1 Tax=Nodosilinea nodulosa TaxID=416001 RepID=UPI00036A4810|nr:NYN domain-containing protein [Nodosilinea nodulosa]